MRVGSRSHWAHKAGDLLPHRGHRCIWVVEGVAVQQLCGERPHVGRVPRALRRGILSADATPRQPYVGRHPPLGCAAFSGGERWAGAAGDLSGRWSTASATAARWSTSATGDIATVDGTNTVEGAAKVEGLCAIAAMGLGRLGSRGLARP